MDGEVPNDPSATALQRRKATTRKVKGDHVVHRRRDSSRSEDRPFLSGFDAISSMPRCPVRMTTT